MGDINREAARNLFRSEGLAGGDVVATALVETAFDIEGLEGVVVAPTGYLEAAPVSEAGVDLELVGVGTEVVVNLTVGVSVLD